jgi:uncharacterized protein DUF4333
MSILARTMVLRRLMSALAMSAAIALVACEQVDKVDTEKAEQEIKRGLSAETGAKLESVRCPDDVEAQKGGVFRCTVTASDGSKVRVKVTQVDDHGGVRWELAGS